MAPNFVLFLTDQLRRDSLGCYGNEICRTPHIDRLARDGVQFDQAYTTSPACSPARASLMSGLYPHNHGVMINTHIAPAWSRGLAPEVPTFSRLLKTAGYALDYAGKWHVHQDLGPAQLRDSVMDGEPEGEGRADAQGREKRIEGSAQLHCRRQCES